jgi:hypothetical protein
MMLEMHLQDLYLQMNSFLFKISLLEWGWWGVRVRANVQTDASLYWGWGRNDTHTHRFIEGVGECKNTRISLLRVRAQRHTTASLEVEGGGECTNTRICLLMVRAQRHTHASVHWGWGPNDTLTHLFVEGEGTRTHEYSKSGWGWLYKHMHYGLCYFVGSNAPFRCVLVWRCRKNFCVSNYLGMSRKKHQND